VINLFQKNMKKKLIITIDGPAGAGKSTVSKSLAEKLGYIYLDTGALYRALAFKALNAQTDLNDISALGKLCANTGIELKKENGSMKVYVDGEDVAGKIRTEEVGLAASRISALEIVRRCLLQIQRKAGERGGIIAEGRDMGSVVFPNADYKFYLDADVDERIKRRHNELLVKGITAEYKKVKEGMIDRDKQDTSRAIAPLMAAADSIIIDSSKLTVNQVVEKIMSFINKDIQS
jgi:CMP/dCMP kinase